MKKLFVYIMVLSVLFAFFGCGKAERSATETNETASSMSTQETEPVIEEKAVTFKRVKSVTIHRQGEDTQTYDVTWDGDVCSFTMTEYGWDPCLTEASYDPATGGLTVHRKPEQVEGDDVTDLTLCYFDQEQILCGLTRPHNLTRYDISYNEKGWPQGDALSLLSVQTDENKMQYSYSRAGMASDEFSMLSYRVVTVDGLGNGIKVDTLDVTTYHDGRKEEELKENTEAYTYDADGDLLKYETDEGAVEFTYTDEVIHHSWERLIPLLCYDFTLVYIIPLFWNLQ